MTVDHRLSVAAGLPSGVPLAIEIKTERRDSHQLVYRDLEYPRHGDERGNGWHLSVRDVSAHLSIGHAQELREVRVRHLQLCASGLDDAAHVRHLVVLWSGRGVSLRKLCTLPPKAVRNPQVESMVRTTGPQKAPPRRNNQGYDHEPTDCTRDDQNRPRRGWHPAPAAAHAPADRARRVHATHRVPDGADPA